MQEIKMTVCESISGGILPALGLLGSAAGGCAVSSGITAAGNYLGGRPLSQGVGVSCAIGAVTGGLGGALVKASGGGMLARAVHAPGMHGLSFGLHSAFGSQGH